MERTIDSYLIDILTGKPWNFPPDYIKAARKAAETPMKLVRVHAGLYMVWTDEHELIEIDCLRDEGRDEWAIREANYRWYGDPAKTLKDAKYSLGLERVES